ncbi:MAG: hypothetical protein VYB59_10990 [Pseudomonadota bacterium]|nr:hypothetical protein [Pseudomonadota bacterium]
MQIVSSENVGRKEVPQAKGMGYRREYIGSPGTINTGPQAFLVERNYPGARISPHFHDIDQFQIVVAGDCTMGKKDARSVTFQYADAYTPYGPIYGENEGFSFFTLRPIASGGFFAMPGNKHKMPGRAGRNIAGHFDTSRPRLAAGEVVRENLMATQDDGVDTVGIRLGPNAQAGGIPSNAGGQYYLVCEGALEGPDGPLPRHSLIHVEAGETPPTLSAGAEGAEVLILQLARPTERPGSDPRKLAERDPNAYVMRPDSSVQ